jgi:hypothetical protein
VLIDGHISISTGVEPGDWLVAHATEVSRSRKVGVYRVDVSRASDQAHIACLSGTVYVTGKPVPVAAPGERPGPRAAELMARPPIRLFKRALAAGARADACMPAAAAAQASALALLGRRRSPHRHRHLRRHAQGRPAGRPGHHWPSRPRSRAAAPAPQRRPPGDGHVVIPTEPRDAYLSRVAAMNAGLPKETPAFNVNRLCGSGLQAIISASQAITLGDCEVAVGAGAESMSRGAYLVPQPAGAPAWATARCSTDGRRAARPVPQDPHGHHGRERGRAVRHQPQHDGRAGRWRATAARPPPSPPAASRSQIVPVVIASARATSPSTPTST